MQNLISGTSWRIAMDASSSAWTISKLARWPSPAARASLIHCSRELSQWMCAKMCSLSQKLYDAGEKPAEDALEANQGATVTVSFLQLLPVQKNMFFHKVTTTRYRQSHLNPHDRWRNAGLHRHSDVRHFSRAVLHRLLRRITFCD
jgi:hypothetical protein